MNDSTTDAFNQISGLAVALGILTMTLAPLSIPILALTAVALLPLAVPLIAVALVGAIVAALARLVRHLERRPIGARRRHRTDTEGRAPVAPVTRRLGVSSR
jgi:membrane protein implicated in regulation of membrane protease activity